MRKKTEAGKNFCRLLRSAALQTAGVFRFEQGRKEARETLRLVAARRKTAVLNYCILPGELFLAMDASAGETRSLAAAFFSAVSRRHNARRRHEGPCWKGRPTVTLAQKGPALEHALAAVSMLPVLRGLARHPSEWTCSGFHELAGIKERYRIIDRKRLCGIAGADDPADLSVRHLRIVESMMEHPGDDAYPFDALAVGGREEVEKIAAMLPDKMREIRRCKIPGLPGALALSASKKWAQAITRRI